MTLRPTIWSFLTLCLCLAVTASAQWRMAVPAYNGPQIQFADGTGSQGAPYLTGYQLTVISGLTGTVSHTYFTCISPDENCIAIAQPYPGPNQIIITANYSDGSAVTTTNTITGAGFEFWTTDGSTNLSYQVKETLQDLTWLPVTTASPFYGYCDAPSQFFKLASNVTNQWFQNSLIPEWPITSSTVQAMPPMP